MYVNHKGAFSISVQIICRTMWKITHVFQMIQYWAMTPLLYPGTIDTPYRYGWLHLLSYLQNSVNCRSIENQPKQIIETVIERLEHWKCASDKEITIQPLESWSILCVMLCVLHNIVLRLDSLEINERQLFAGPRWFQEALLTFPVLVLRWTASFCFSRLLTLLCCFWHCEAAY